MSACRLCGGEIRAAFRAKILDRFDVGYYRCSSCQSLQTEPPYWLHEAYSQNSGATDTGAVGRNLNCQAIVHAVARSLGVAGGASILDFGGGSGLLCRMLRDRGFDARLSDRYVENIFAKGFEDDLRAHYEICCAFEVVEHFPKPMEDMAEIFNRSNSLCIIGTETYSGQGSDWWYLNPRAGQHVFFYSEEGMEFLARKNDFYYFRIGNTHLFSKQQLSKTKRFLVKSMICGPTLRIVRAYLAFSLSFDHAMEDFRTMT